MSRNTTRVKVKTNVPEMRKLFASLSSELKLKFLKQALRKQGRRLNDAARPKIPLGVERTGRKEGKRHLRDTLTTTGMKWATPDVVYVVAGPGYPSGAHSHLVEFGHRTQGGGMTRAFPFMRAAAAETMAANAQEMANGAKRWLKKQHKKLPKTTK